MDFLIPDRFYEVKGLNTQFEFLPHSAYTPFMLMKPTDFPRTVRVLDESTGPGGVPGAVLGAFSLKHPQNLFLLARGHRRIIPTPQPMQTDTSFDVSSLTKVLTTASLATLLIERGGLSWTTPVRSFFDQPSFDGIEIRHLLSHTAGFNAWKPYWEMLRSQFGPEVHLAPISDRQNAMRKLILETAPEARPGERCVYSDVSALLLGFILEDVLRMPLDQAASTLIWEPWGLRSLRYHRIDAMGAHLLLDEVAATENCPWRHQVLQGQVHDDNCWAMGGYSGHAGVFGNAEDILLFARKWMQNAWTPALTRKAWTKVQEPVGCERTMGWDTPSGQTPSCGKYFSASTVGHLGFTGVSLWIDPQEGLAVTLLTNRVHPSRENLAIRAIRPKIHDAFREDWKELHR